MKLILRAVHYRAGARMRRFVEAQLLEPLELFLPEPAAELDVVLRDGNGLKGGMDKECSVTVFIPGAQPLHLTEVSEDMYKSVHLMRDRVERAVRKYLERRRDHAHEPPPAQGIGNL
jgi:ribosome-associated translation inhibitor RaiA